MSWARIRPLATCLCWLSSGLLGVSFSTAFSTASADGYAPSVRKLATGERRLPSIMVTVLGLKNSQGRVGCALFKEKQDWLTPHAIAGVKHTVPRNHKVICEFRNVPPGTYAVAITHDEDDDGEVDRGLFGIPTEGYCTSRDAKANFGPPTWYDASFKHHLNKPTILRSTMRY